jgi:hypothetical protein
MTSQRAFICLKEISNASPIVIIKTLTGFSTCDINAYLEPLLEICQPAGVKIWPMSE